MRKSNILKVSMGILMSVVTMLAGMSGVVQAEEQLGGNGEWVAAKLQNEVGIKWVNSEEYKVITENRGYDEYSNGYVYLFDDNTKMVYDWKNSKMTLDDWVYVNTYGLKFKKKNGKLELVKQEQLGTSRPESGGGCGWPLYVEDYEFEFKQFKGVETWVDYNKEDKYYYDVYIVSIGYFRNAEERERDYARFTDYFFIPEDHAEVFELLDHPEKEEITTTNMESEVTEPTSAESTEANTVEHTEANTETSAEVNTATNTEANTEASTETNTEASTETNAEASTETSAEASTETNAEASTETNAEVNTEASTAANAEVNTEMSTAINAEVSTQLSTESNTEVNTEINTEKNTEQYTEGETTSAVFDNETTKTKENDASDSSGIGKLVPAFVLLGVIVLSIGILFVIKRNKKSDKPMK